MLFEHLLFTSLNDQHTKVYAQHEYITTYITFTIYHHFSYSEMFWPLKTNIKVHSA